MTSARTLEFTLPNEFLRLIPARKDIKAYFKEHLYSESLMQDLSIVVDEAINLVAKKSSKRESGFLHVRLELADVSDDLACLSLDIKLDLANREGMVQSDSFFGLKVLHRIMDRVQCHEEEGFIDRLVIRKWFNNAPPHPRFLGQLIRQLQASGYLPEVGDAIAQQMVRKYPHLEEGEIVLLLARTVERDPQEIKDAILRLRLGSEPLEVDLTLA